MEYSIPGIVELLRQSTSIAVVSDFLRSKGLHHSASSWNALLEERIQPAINEGALSVQELINLLRETEESGRQHIFLYRTSAAAAADLLDPERIEAVVREAGLEAVMAEPRLLDLPGQPTIVDIRSEPDAEYLVVKVVEKRTRVEFVGQEREGNMVSRLYREIDERAVNIARLSRAGLLEIRIGSHKNSTQYNQDVQLFWDMISEIIPREGFSELSLNQAKHNLWENRRELRSEIRFGATTLKNDMGTGLKVSAGSEEQDIYEDAGAEEGVSAFMNHDAYCDSSNVTFLQQENGTPSRGIHVLLSGLMNEWAITSHCSRADYEHVLNRLQSLNS